ncbi:nitrogen regulatory IIA protein [Elizabethkingia anophelis]|nr:nitrogen regulatory IIA protein [Terrimonas sp.]MDV3734902.1 nitrogen regulatory IIA protein [Elizabethkingia anophelis]MDV3964596.1 nitrogen regulatory IIA protein [Elizabethkingia anophelis]OJY93899.1 MAG: nitrogen regulatory IIA protein [Sphingobacteriales bacterium 40-81]
MKKLRTKISKWFDRLDDKWRELPVKKQHRYTLFLFAGYLLLSVIVIAKVCYDVGASDSKLKIEHIENPLIKQKKSPVSSQDSISKILKNQLYER